MPKKKEETEVKEEKKDEEVKSGPSKLPDFGEVVNMGKTLFCSVKKGVKTIVSDYKKKRQ